MTILRVEKDEMRFTIFSPYDAQTERNIDLSYAIQLLHVTLGGILVSTGVLKRGGGGES